MTFEGWWKAQKKWHPFANREFAEMLWETLRPEGYVLVPKEPTEAMLSAVNGNDLMSWDSEAIYKAMIEAAQEGE